MGAFKEFYLNEDKELLSGFHRFEVHYDGKIIGTMVAKDSESALSKAKLKWFGKSGFSGNEPVKVKKIK